MAKLLTLFSIILTADFVRGLQYSKGHKDFRLKLSSYSDEELRGCYEHSLHFKLCFELGPDFMKLSSTNGTALVHLHSKKDRQLWQIRILNGHFHHRSPAATSDLAYEETDEPLVDLIADQNHLKEKLERLREVPEMKLVERLSAALGRQEKQIEALPKFHATLRVLLKTMNLQLSPEFRATRHPEDKIRKKRCVEPNADECLGLCGYGCWCWSWVCGDCCLHTGCQQHDRCCREGSISSHWCLLPFLHGFSCDGYGGYPACLS